MGFEVEGVQNDLNDRRLTSIVEVFESRGPGSRSRTSKPQTIDVKRRLFGFRVGGAGFEVGEVENDLSNRR